MSISFFLSVILWMVKCNGDDWKDVDAHSFLQTVDEDFNTASVTPTVISQRAVLNPAVLFPRASSKSEALVAFTTAVAQTKTEKNYEEKLESDGGLDSNLLSAQLEPESLKAIDILRPGNLILDSATISPIFTTVIGARTHLTDVMLGPGTHATSRFGVRTLAQVAATHLIKDSFGKAEAKALVGELYKVFKANEWLKTADWGLFKGTSHSEQDRTRFCATYPSCCNEGSPPKTLLKKFHADPANDLNDAFDTSAQEPANTMCRLAAMQDKRDDLLVAIGAPLNAILPQDNKKRLDFFRFLLASLYRCSPSFGNVDYQTQVKISEFLGSCVSVFETLHWNSAGSHFEKPNISLPFLSGGDKADGL